MTTRDPIERALGLLAVRYGSDSSPIVEARAELARLRTPAPPPHATDPHEPKEPRRAPTRERLQSLILGIHGAGVVEGDQFASDRKTRKAADEISAYTAEILAAFDALAAERDEWKRRAEAAEAERDAALAKLNDWRFARWRELPEAERKIAGDLLNAAGHREKESKPFDARACWWAGDCLDAITDTLPPPKDPRIEAWRALDAEARFTIRRGLFVAGHNEAAAALEALGEGK